MEDQLNDNAVSVYGENEAMDDFPVLKAFQQYIDAEQAKARKRLLSLSIFFGILLSAVIAVFVVLVLNVSARNQQLNDRLVEFAMRERDRVPVQSAPVVVQPSAPAENSAIVALTTRIEDMQKKLSESEAKARKIEAESAEKVRIAAAAAAEAAKPKAPSPQEIEIARLRAQLSLENKLAAAERERQRQAELDAYRRKHYPECYPPVRTSRRKAVMQLDTDELDDEEDAITYFDDAEEEIDERPVKVQKKKKAKTVASKKATTSASAKENSSAKETPSQPKITPEANILRTNTIDVEVQGSKRSWNIPLE